MFKNTFFGAVVVVGILGIVPVVYTAGAGGGGGSGSVSTPSCTEDTWQCTDWSLCSNTGTQTRICTQTFDCTFVFSNRPSEEQSCAVPVPEKKTVEVKKQEPVSAPSVCTADNWTCSEWASTCDVLGKQHRACSLTFDCPIIETPSPTIEKSCDKLQCGNKRSMKERIECRLKLSEEAIEKELWIQYLPEECRSLKKGAKQNICIERYKAFKPCWEKQEGEERFICAKDVLKLGPQISSTVKECKGKKGKEQVACKTAVREKVFSMVKFRFYDLSERAEELREKGVPVKTVAVLVNNMETLKQQFNRSSSASARRNLVLKARAEWKQFVKLVIKKDKILADFLLNDNLDAALNDLKAVE